MVHDVLQPTQGDSEAEGMRWPFHNQTAEMGVFCLRLVLMNVWIPGPQLDSGFSDLVLLPGISENTVKTTP